MLVADIKYVDTSLGECNFKGYLVDNGSNIVMNLRAEDGVSNRLMWSGLDSYTDRLVRIFQCNGSSYFLEKAMLKGTVYDDNRVDKSSLKYYRSDSSSFKFYSILYSLLWHLKTVETSSTSDINTSAMHVDESNTSQSVRDVVTLEGGSGVVVRKFNYIESLHGHITVDGCSLEISISDDDTITSMSANERKSLFGSAILSVKNAKCGMMKVSFKQKLRNHVLSIPDKVDLNFEGIGDSYNPFFDTLDELLSAEKKRAYAENRKPKDIQWILDRFKSGAYHIVREGEERKYFDLLEEQYAQVQLLGLDSETTGTKFNFKCFLGEGSKIVGAVISAMAGYSYYFPLGHKRFPNVCGGDIEYFMTEYLQPFIEGKRVVCHNNDFDWRVFYAHGCVYDCYMDTMVFIRGTYTAQSKSFTYGLKDNVERFLGRTAFELDDLCKNGSFKETVANNPNINFSNISEELVGIYACPDADNTLSLALYFRDNGIIDKFNAWKWYLNNSRFTSVIAYCQFYGNHLDMDRLPELYRHYSAEYAKAYSELYDFLIVSLAGKTFDGKQFVLPLKEEVYRDLVARDKAMYEETAIYDSDGKVVGYSGERNFPLDLSTLDNVILRNAKAYSVQSSALGATFAYDYLGYPVQLGNSGNPSLGKDAIKYLSSFTGKTLEPFTVDIGAFRSAIAGTSSRFSKSGTALAYLDSLVGGYPYTDDEFVGRYCLDLAFKFAYAEEYGFKSTYELVDGKGSVLVTPEKNPPLYPFVGLMKKTRDIARIFSTFFDKIATYFTSDGFCFPSINQFLVTGRLSTSDPNIQGSDTVLKNSITARDGYYMVDMDYASKENRVIATMSKEQSLIELFQDPRNDYHRYQASRLKGILQEQVTDTDRNLSKGLVFGINYGMSDASLGSRLFGEVSPENTREAYKKRELFFSFQPHVRDWFDDNVKMAMQKGYSETLFNSRRYYNRSTQSTGSIRRYALNHPIQGSAADIFKFGMCALFDDIKANGYLGKILLTGFIHDEATLEVDKSIHPLIVLGLLRKNMMVKIEGGCPLDIGFGVGTSWYHSKKTEWQVGLQEKLEWKVDAYDWDGDVEKFDEWAIQQIHDFYAEDIINMLDRVNFTESTPLTERLFSINYALELSKYIQVSLSEGDTWRKVTDIIDFPADYEGMDVGSRSSFVFKAFGELGIRERLIIFKRVTGYSREGIEDMFVNLDDIPADMRNANDNVEKMDEREARLRIIKNRVIDYGLYVDTEAKLVVALETPALLGSLGSLLTESVGSSSEYKFVCYDMRTDSLRGDSKFIIDESRIGLLRPLVFVG